MVSDRIGQTVRSDVKIGGAVGCCPEAEDRRAASRELRLMEQRERVSRVLDARR
jgi:hypothetical protein